MGSREGACGVTLPLGASWVNVCGNTLPLWISLEGEFGDILQVRLSWVGFFEGTLAGDCGDTSPLWVCGGTLQLWASCCRVCLTHLSGVEASSFSSEAC